MNSQKKNPTQKQLKNFEDKNEAISIEEALKEFFDYLKKYLEEHDGH